MHRDTVIGIVGVVILVAAMVGVFTYERGQASDLLTGPGGETMNFTAPAVTGNVAVGSTSENLVTLNQTGITNVTFTLTWTPGANSVDTLVLVVAPPNGTGDPVESSPESDGEITLTIPVANTGAGGTLGVGDWQVVVEFVSAELSTPVQPPIQPPVGPSPDTEVDFSVDVSGTAYGSA